MRRAAGLASVAGALIALPSAALGEGHTYTVLQCHSLNRSHSDAVLQDTPAYDVRGDCGDPQSDYAIRITNRSAAGHRGYGIARWATKSNALSIVGVRVDAKLRRDRGHAARLWMADSDQRETARIAAGGSSATDYQHETWSTSGYGQRQFVASLSCQLSSGCPQSNFAKTFVRNLRLKVADYSDPRFVALSGPLLSTGWHRGSEELYAQGTDPGSGLAAILATVNGSQLARISATCDSVPGTSDAARFRVCDGNLTLDPTPSTALAPFHDGANSVSVCVLDFAGNRTCGEHTLDVDNTPPAVAFSISQDPDDPELIRASVNDAISGVSSGQIFYRPAGQTSWRPLDTQLDSDELRARVNSVADPPGNYEFMAEATDIAGNVTQTSSRADGQPMTLAFPLKSGVKLNAYLGGGSSRETVGYGQSSRVSGRLRSSSGQALANQAVTVTEYFGAGALIDRRVRTVQTDSDGFWGERLPAGPSRKVTATYGGSNRYVGDDAKAGDLRVRTKATFRLSRGHVHEGRRVVFSGRVGHLAARIPAGGKLVELEVKDGGRWNTVRHPFYTGNEGRYRLPYRFGRFYNSDVKYRFRVKVLRERGWPYKAPVSSRVRKLVVKAR